MLLPPSTNVPKPFLVRVPVLEMTLALPCVTVWPRPMSKVRLPIKFTLFVNVGEMSQKPSVPPAATIVEALGNAPTVPTTRVVFAFTAVIPE